VEENFIDFIHFVQKTGLEISKMILDKICQDGLDIKDCRGQAYDNGANMAGAYKGVQARIQEANPRAVFVPCCAHSLNLIGQHAASNVLNGKLILGTIKNLYQFFSSSPARWDVMKKHLKKTLKMQSTTRWSSKAMAVSVLVDEFEQITDALMELIDSETSNAHTVTEANSVFGLVNNFKFLLGATIWK